MAYMWNLKKNDITEFIYKTERVTDIENKLMVTIGESRGGGQMNWEVEIDIRTLLYIK